MHSASDLIRAVAALASAVVWPGLLALVVIRFAPQIRDFAANLAELSFKGFGVDVSAKRSRATAALTAAEAQFATRDAAAAAAGGEGAPSAAVAPSAASIAASVAQLAQPSTISRVAGVRILWVDDHPENNRFERESLEALGLIVETSLSTADALARIAREGFGVVITDLGRRSAAESDDLAGLSLINAMRSAGKRLPVIVYGGRRALEHRADLLAAGAEGVAEGPRSLFDLVVRAASR